MIETAHDRHAPAVRTLGRAVLRAAFDQGIDPVGDPCREPVAADGRRAKAQVNHVNHVVQVGVAHDFPGQVRAQHAVHRHDFVQVRDLAFAFQEGVHDFIRDCAGEVVARAGEPATDARFAAGLGALRHESQRGAQIDLIQAVYLFQQVRAAYEVLQAVRAKLGCDAPHFFRNHIEDSFDTIHGQVSIARGEVFDALFAGFVHCLDVGRDTHMTGTLMTLPTDRAAHGDHRHRRKTHTVSTEQNHLHGVPAGLHATVTPQLHAPAQPGFQQRAVRLDHADFGGQPHVLQRMAAGRARRAIVAGEVDDVGPGLGDADRDHAHAWHHRDFDRDAGVGVHGFEFLDQLGEVLN